MTELTRRMNKNEKKLNKFTSTKNLKSKTKQNEEFELQTEEEEIFFESDNEKEVEYAEEIEYKRNKRLSNSFATLAKVSNYQELVKDHYFQTPMLPSCENLLKLGDEMQNNSFNNINNLTKSNFSSNFSSKKDSIEKNNNIFVDRSFFRHFNGDKVEISRKLNEILNLIERIDEKEVLKVDILSNFQSFIHLLSSFRIIDENLINNE